MSCSAAAPPPPCEEGIDFGIIMDRSGSVGSTNFDKCKSFVKNLVDTFQISPRGTRAGIIAYSSDSQLIVNFADDNSQTPSAMKDIIDKYLNLIFIFIPVHFYTTSNQQSKLTATFCFIRKIHFFRLLFRQV